MSGTQRHNWLSLTPEPERDLPAAVATLRAGCEPTREQVAEERERAERLVLGGRRRAWTAWLREAGELAERADPANGPAVAGASELVLDVINNHDALELGLPGRLRRPEGAERETFERVRTRNEKGSAR